MSEPLQRPSLSTWLSWEEFKTAFALQWVALHLECYGYEDMSDTEREATFSSYGRALMWAIRKLSAAGLRFTGLQVDPDGAITATRDTPVEPRNALFLQRLAKGKMPAPVNVPWGEARGAGGGFLEVALDVIQREGLQIETEPIRHALSDVTAAVLEARSQLSPEEIELQGRAFRNMLDEIGVAIVEPKGAHARRPKNPRRDN